MTTAEKAKAYDEALARANELYNRGYTSITGEIFPELAESEDEKIRKNLKHYLEVRRCQTNDDEEYINCNHFLAWLEKQGEQKPEENKGNIGGVSPNWSEEDENILGDIIEDVMTLHSGKTLGVIRNKINWLKSIKDRVGCEANCTTTKEKKLKEE